MAFKDNCDRALPLFTHSEELNILMSMSFSSLVSIKKYLAGIFDRWRSLWRVGKTLSIGYTELHRGRPRKTAKFQRKYLVSSEW